MPVHAPGHLCLLERRWPGPCPPAPRDLCLLGNYGAHAVRMALTMVRGSDWVTFDWANRQSCLRQSSLRASSICHRLLDAHLLKDLTQGVHSLAYGLWFEAASCQWLEGWLGNSVRRRSSSTRFHSASPLCQDLLIPIDSVRLFFIF